MTTSRSKAVVLAAALVLIATVASANILVKLPREKMWSRADLVVVATPLTCPAFKNSRRNRACQFRVVETLKGSSLSAVRVERETNIAEESVAGCCKVARLYVLYLRQWQGRWYSVHGHWGVIDLKSKAAS